ncbi:MAG: hypothetical protein GKS02_10240 [Alphaproteobacteria bacterium]|nr:hypothetical protein [Alphaproteobacteria bacterium]
MDKMITSAARRARRIFSSNQPLTDPVFGRVGEQFNRAQYFVRIYYIVSAFISYSLMNGLHARVLRSGEWDYLWPLAWLAQINDNSIIEWLPVAALFASLFAFQFPAFRVFRVVFAILCLFTAAAFNSQGSISHGLHVWFWIGFGLVFLPNAPANHAVPRTVKMTYLSVIVAVQALILFFYTLAGFWKILAGLTSLLRGVEGNFSPRGLSLQLADRMLQTGTSPLLADVVIANFWLSWPMFLALIYIQLVAVIIVLRPRLHVLWGYLLMMFHLGTWLLMEIAFQHHILFLGLLFVMSPFRPRSWTVRDAISDLPVFGRLLALGWRTHPDKRVGPVPAE